MHCFSCFIWSLPYAIHTFVTLVLFTTAVVLSPAISYYAVLFLAHLYRTLSVISPLGSDSLRSELKFCCSLLVRPKAIACGAELSFSLDVLFFIYFFLPTRDHRDAWADRRKILHDGQN